MTTDVAARTEPARYAPPRTREELRAIDTDVHNDLPSYQELKPFLARQWYPWLDDGGPGLAARAYANTGSGVMDDAVREEDELAAGDPEWVIQQLLVKYRIDIGVMTGTMTQMSIQHNRRFCAAIVSAYNDWLLEKWVRPYPCFKGSINVTPQDPEAAKTINKMENRDLDFHRRVHAGFHTEAERAPERIYVVDATRPIKQVQQSIWREVERRLRLRKIEN